MKPFATILVLAGVCLMWVNVADAEETWTIEKIYTHYETNYTLKDTLHFAQRAALYIAGQCEQGQQACETVIGDFSKPSEWGILDVKHLWIAIIGIEKRALLAHANPGFKKNINKRVGSSIKDHNGKLYFLEGAAGIKLQPKGFFFSKYSTWVKSVTKIKEPIHQLNLYVLIPETTMVVATNYPYRATSVKEVDEMAAELNNMVEAWSIIQGRVVYPK